MTAAPPSNTLKLEIIAYQSCSESAAALSRHSFTCKPDALSGLDACRDLYLQGLRSAARLVRVLDRDGLFAAMNGLIEGYLDLRI